MDKSQVVGVLMGGLSSERDVSLRTGENVLAALKARGWKAVGFDLGRDAPAKLVEAGVDVVPQDVKIVMGTKIHDNFFRRTHKLNFLHNEEMDTLLNKIMIPKSGMGLGT